MVNVAWRERTAKSEVKKESMREVSFVWGTGGTLAYLDQKEILGWGEGSCVLHAMNYQGSLDLAASSHRVLAVRRGSAK